MSTFDSSEVFRQVVDGMDQGLLLSYQGKVVFSNAFAKTLFGFEPAGRLISEVQALLSTSDGGSHDSLQGEILVTNPSQERQTRCYLNLAPLSRDGADDHFLVWTFFELTPEIANTRAFVDFSAELKSLNQVIRTKNEEILRLSRTDRLTDAANRETILEMLEKAIDFRSIPGNDLAVVLFDLDGFREVNERVGQTLGDRLLRQVCGMVNAELGPLGTLGRLAGNTFLVIFPGLDQEQARTFAEEIRTTIQRETSLLGIPVTVTIGVAVCREDTDVDGLLAAAFRALRDGKAAGRNRVVVSS